MLKTENIVVSNTMQWKSAVLGARNAMDSWDRSDTDWASVDDTIKLGPNDLDLACRLIKAGSEHRKFLRMIHVQMDITAPLYWWKEMDQYKIGTTTNSCSTMHKIHAKEFVMDDFSCEHLFDDPFDEDSPINVLFHIINVMNWHREQFLKTRDKAHWWQMIQLLPSSYNQKRTWDGSLETILSILSQRKGHKLNEWEVFRQKMFDNIPYCKEFYEAMHGKENMNNL